MLKSKAITAFLFVCGTVAYTSAIVSKVFFFNLIQKKQKIPGLK